MGDSIQLGLLLLLCMGASFLFSGMEAGVFALSRLRIRKLRRMGNERAGILYGYLENSENFLWTILVGNTLANFAAVSLAFVFLYRLLGGRPLLCWSVFVAGGFLFYAFCELFPKMLFRLYPNRLCLALARPFRTIHVVLRPLVGLVEWFSRGLLRWTGGRRFTGHLFGNREELRFLMQDSVQGLTTEERVLINRVLDLQTLVVREITRPLSETVTVGKEAPIRSVLKIFAGHQLNRMPVVDSDSPSRRVIGMISLESLIYRTDLDLDRRAGDFLKPALFLDESLRVEEAMRRMQRGGRRLAIVLGRDQQEIGIVSFQDILKVIFGEVKL